MFLKRRIIFILIFSLFFLAEETKKANAEGVDLSVEEIAINNATPDIFEEVTITVKVKNNGTNVITDSQGFYNFLTSFNGFEIDSQQFQLPSASNRFDPGEYMNYVFTGQFKAISSQKISFTIDDGDKLQEADEKNNSKSITVSVKGNDLKADSIVVVPAKPAQNQDCIITVKIKNAGTYNLYSSSGLSSYEYKIDNFQLKSFKNTFPTLGSIIAPNGFMEYKFYGQFTKQGDNKVEFTIDKDENFEEALEDNNFISKTFTVVDPSKIDIAVDSISLSKQKPIVSQEMDITVKIKNLGSVSILDKYGLRNDDAQINFNHFLITEKSQDNYPTSENPFELGETYTYNFKGYFNVMGDYAMPFTVDKSNLLNDAIMANNTKTATGTVYASEEEANRFHIIDYSVANNSSSSVLIKWQTDKETTGKLIYRENYYGSSETTKTTTGTKKAHEVALTGLKPGTGYVYRIISTLESETEEIQPTIFTTLASDSISFTKEPVILKNNESYTANIAWSTNLATDGYVFYKKSGEENYKSVGVSGKTIDHNIQIVDLEAGSYELYVESKSGVGTKIESQKYTIVFADWEAEENSEVPSEGKEEGKAEESAISGEKIVIKNSNLYKNLKGKIILKVESKGEAYYVHPKTESMYFLGRPADAFNIMRSQGIGITNVDLGKIPVGLGNISGSDTDGDGLSDSIEDALGTDKNKKDTDSDGFNDKEEIGNNYNPLGSGKSNISSSFTAGKIGLIFLQVEKKGEAWYVNPADSKRYFLGRPADAFNVMKFLGLGISNVNFNSL